MTDNLNPPDITKVENSRSGKGRPVGSKNKNTEAIREYIKEIVAGQLPHVEEALERVREKHPDKYLSLFTRLIELTIPRQQAIELTNTPTIDVEASIKAMKDSLGVSNKSDK